MERRQKNFFDSFRETTEELGPVSKLTTTLCAWAGQGHAEKNLINFRFYAILKDPGTGEKNVLEGIGSGVF